MRLIYFEKTLSLELGFDVEVEFTPLRKYLKVTSHDTGVTWLIPRYRWLLHQDKSLAENVSIAIKN